MQLLHQLHVPWREVDLLKLGGCKGFDAHPWGLRLGAGAGSWCATGYIVTHRGARRLRDVQTPVWTVADGVLRLWDNSSEVRIRGSGGQLEIAPGVRVMHTVPAIVTQGWGGVFYPIWGCFLFDTCINMY